jgi:hypothetical protein
MSQGWKRAFRWIPQAWGTAHSEIILSSPPLRMFLLSMEKVTQSVLDTCLKLAMVHQSESCQRQTWLSWDVDAISVPAGLKVMALIVLVWPVQGSPTCCQVVVSHSCMVGLASFPLVRRCVLSGVHMSEKFGNVWTLNDVTHCRNNNTARRKQGSWLYQ